MGGLTHHHSHTTPPSPASLACSPLRAAQETERPSDLKLEGAAVVHPTESLGLVPWDVSRLF